MLEVSGGATGDNKLRQKAAEDSEVTVHIWGPPPSGTSSHTLLP